MSANDNGLASKPSASGNEAAPANASKLSLSSLAIHADDALNSSTDVAPPMHVSTTFRYNSDYTKLSPWNDGTSQAEVEGPVYSRLAGPNTTRLEHILTSLLSGPSITYTSGLSAFHALLVLLNPRRISIGAGYHGCHGVIGIHKKLTGLTTLPLDCDPEDLHEGDIVHIETPLNPTGYAYNLQAFAEKAHARGAVLTVDATFAPPPLQDPFAWGADIVLHSGTKYFGGHSDMLCGVLVVNPAAAKAKEWEATLREERMFMGSVMGSMEGWLGVRSLRTLEVRLERQVKNTAQLVQWLDSAVGAAEQSVVKATVDHVEHTSLQRADIEDGWLLRQMPNGFGPVFSIVMRTQEMARRLPSHLKLFHHATSLGGVESLIEWRCMSDTQVDKRLMRVSVGIEAWEDLKADLEQAFAKLEKELGTEGEGK